MVDRAKAVGLLCIFIVISAAASWCSSYGYINFDCPGATSTSILDINNSGQIVGYYFDATGVHGFLSALGSPGCSTVEPPGSTLSEASGINDAGFIVGLYHDNADRLHGFTYDGATYTTIDYPTATTSYTLDVDNNGLLLGAFIGDVTQQAYLDNAGTFTVFDVPGSAYDQPGHFNSLGQVAGYFIDSTNQHRGFVYDINTSGFTLFDAPGSTFTHSIGINDSGQVTGYYRDAAGNDHGFVKTGATFDNVNYPGATNTQPASMNNAGVVVGSYDSGPSSTHSFIATPGNPPVANAGVSQTVQCAGPGGTNVTLDGSASYDPDGRSLSFTWKDSSDNVIGTTPKLNLSLSPGTYTFTLVVSDTAGFTATAYTQVTVQDTQAPALTLALSPNVLWPPNNKPVPISATISTSDVCSATPSVTLVSISGSLPISPGDVQGASFGADDRTFSLRAIRGQVYTVTYRATDLSGNKTTASATVTVPNDQGH